MGVIGCDIQPVQNFRMLKYMGMDKKIEHGNYLITLGFKGNLQELTQSQHD